MDKIILSGSGLYTPTQAISNEELVLAFNTYVEKFNHDNQAKIAAGEIEALLPSSAEFILKASGIKSRYVMDKAGILDPELMRPTIPERPNDEKSIQVEMAYAAAQQALKQANKTAADIDAVYIGCSNMQRPYPAMAIELQHALGTKGYAFDLNVACSSATFTLQTAYNAIKANNARCVLIANPEICTAHLNFRDRDSHFIFGDACTAMVVEAEATCSTDNGFEIISCALETQFSNNIRNNMGFLYRCDPNSLQHADKLFIQQGRKVFKEVTPAVIKMIQQHLQAEGIAASDLQRLWLHQANCNMNRLITQKLLGDDNDPLRAPVILDEYANTSSAGSVIAFHKHKDDLPRGALGILCSFGAGYSIGNVILCKQ